MLVSCQHKAVKEESSLCHLVNLKAGWESAASVPDVLRGNEKSSRADVQYLWYKKGNSRLLMCTVAKNPSPCSMEEGRQFIEKNGEWRFKEGSWVIRLCTGD
jgi:hypothetical protein